MKFGYNLPSGYKEKNRFKFWTDGRACKAHFYRNASIGVGIQLVIKIGPNIMVETFYLYLCSILVEG